MRSGERKEYPKGRGDLIEWVLTMPPPPQSNTVALLTPDREGEGQGALSLRQRRHVCDIPETLPPGRLPLPCLAAWWPTGHIGVHGEQRHYDLGHCGSRREATISCGSARMICNQHRQRLSGFCAPQPQRCGKLCTSRAEQQEATDPSCLRVCLSIIFLEQRTLTRCPTRPRNLVLLSYALPSLEVRHLDCRHEPRRGHKTSSRLTVGTRWSQGLHGAAAAAATP